MAKKNEKEPGFWRGYVWGILWTPLIVTAATFVISIPIALVAGRKPPGAKYWGNDDDVSPPPIDVEAR